MEKRRRPIREKRRDSRIHINKSRKRTDKETKIKAGQREETDKQRLKGDWR